MSSEETIKEGSNEVRPALDRSLTFAIGPARNNLVISGDAWTDLTPAVRREPQTSGMIEKEDWDKLQKYFNGNNTNRQPWEIIPFRQRRGEPRMYEPELPIVYLNRAYMHLELRHIDKPNIVYKFPRPELDNRLYRKTSRIMLTIDANTHAYYNVWGVDFRFEPTFQLSYPRNAYTLRLLR